MKSRAKGLLARKMDDPAYRRRHEESYELLKLEVQFLNALEKKNWTYADLAKVMHTQKSGISRDLKDGGLRSASMARVAKMAEALGLKLFSFCVAERKAKRVLPIINNLVAETQELLSEPEMLKGVRKAKRDIEAGRTYPLTQVFGS